jgi:Protein of unknown function (DUF3768)
MNTPTMMATPIDRVKRIRELNDDLRINRRGGKIVVTSGIHAEGPYFVAALLLAIAAFNDFREENGLWGEHDCASTTFNGVDVLWKIDYFDPSLTSGSPDPADPAVTIRLLTIMRVDEY